MKILIIAMCCFVVGCSTLKEDTMNNILSSEEYLVKKKRLDSEFDMRKTLFYSKLNEIGGASEE